MMHGQKNIVPNFCLPMLLNDRFLRRFKHWNRTFKCYSG